jgi:hypothetical protein
MVIDGDVASMGAIAGVGRSLGGVASRGRMQYAPPVNMAMMLWMGLGLTPTQAQGVQFALVTMN